MLYRRKTTGYRKNPRLRFCKD